MVATVRTKLGPAVETVDGALAMHLARKLSTEETSASGAAALAKEIAARVTAATGKPVADSGDPLDEMARRRAQRAAGSA